MSRDDWRTPRKLFNHLDSIFDFTLDGAADETNHLCERWTSDFFSVIKPRPPAREVIFLNPPYSSCGKFAMRALHLYEMGDCQTVMLLPVRTDRLWFNTLIETQGVQLTYLTGRLHFDEGNKSAFMYNCIVTLHWNRDIHMPKSMDASQFNVNGKGGAKS